MSDWTEAQLSELPMVAYVADDSRVVLNRGRLDGVKVGQRFLIFGIGREIEDPRTKQKLGRLESVRGTGRVVHLQDRLATIDSDMSVPGKRVVKKPTPFGLASAWPSQYVEEEQEPPIPIGFSDPAVGDYAKPV
jgi:hypothetical protein